MRFYQFNSVDFGYYALIGAENDVKAMEFYHEEVNEIESFDNFSPEWIHENTVREKLLGCFKTDKQREEINSEFEESIKDNKPWLILLDRCLS